MALGMVVPLGAAVIPLPHITLPVPLHRMALPTPQFSAQPVPRLPHPRVVPRPDEPLVSLDSAILLGLRMSPAIVSARLERVTQKYQLLVAKNQFMPHVHLGGSYARENVGSREEQSNLSATPSIDYTNYYGTHFNASMSDSYNDSQTGNRTQASTLNLSITQPLLNGAGKEVVTSGLMSAIEGERINKMSFRNTLMSQVNQIISSYHQLISDYLQVQINQENVKVSEEQVKQTKTRLRLGQATGSDLVQQQSSLATARLSVVSSQRKVHTQTQSLLILLGLDPNKPFRPDLSLDHFKMYPTPSKAECIRLAKANSLTYQQAKLGITQAERALHVAKNQMKWTVDLTASTQLAHGSGSGLPAGKAKDWLGPTTHSPTGDKNVGINVTIPVDDMGAKSNLLSARVGLRQAHQSLVSTEQSIQSNVRSTLYALESSKHSYILAKQALQLAKQNLANSELSYKFGRTSAFQVSQLRSALIQAQIGLVNAKIGYIGSYMSLRLLIGKVLDDWHIAVKT